ncbi:MAG: tetratricopeptide repeat protein [Leptolyngbyaceae cyanobacterium CSU_1_3]|nr:tetratricopeptide repeat protein [Leptolyngbyaceae cyanobacterium CSU_1_3]
MSQPATIDSSKQSAINQRNLRRLVLSVQASIHKLNLLIAVCDNPRYRDELIRTYEAELTAKGIVCYQVLLDRQQPSLKQSLLDWQAGLSDQQREIPTLVTVRGGDELLAVRLQESKSAQERFFFSVQWTREGLRDFQLPIVLWVTQAVSEGLAQQAPDFWSWRGGVFEFVQSIAVSFGSANESSEIAARIDSTNGNEPTNQSATPADPTALMQQIADLQAEDPNSPLLESLYESLGEAYYERLEQGLAVDRPQEEAAAIDAFQSAIAYRETLPDLTLLARSLSYLGLLYKSQGRYEAAEPLYVRSLQIREQQLGGDHPATATSLNNLAMLYESQGRYEEAEPLYVRSLEINQKTLPENHPSTQLVWNNFRYLVQQAVDTGRSAELSDHPITQAILRDTEPRDTNA